MRKVVDLNGTWRMRQAGQAEWLTATVPGCVHTDLLAAGRIPDPLVALNELDVLWIDEADWEYERTFTVDEADLHGAAHHLLCEGLDTVAEISINNQPVAATRNMFRAYRFDVTDVLKAGENTIRIIFRSPVRYGASRQAQDGFERPGTEYTWACGRTRKVYRPYVRKAQYQFGWDWGPCLATSGVWRDIRLVSTRTPLLEYVTTQQDHSGGGVALRATAHLHVPQDTAAELQVYWDGAAEPIATQQSRIATGKATMTAEFDVPTPELWWPAGMGSQRRYLLEVRVVVGGDVADTHQTRIGLRQVELVRAADADGESFTFRINGRDVFCKGANWIPADPFPPRVSREQYDALIAATVDANMNMLRVWGGGIYEDHAFYEACDARGVLIWQDYMFACAVYPTDTEFLDEVRAEVTHQTRRLINHPSIVLWCGDNENEWLTGAFWEGTGDYPPLLPDHDRLINQTVAPIVRAEDPARPWWPSSPAGGPEPNSVTHGDTHWWAVWSWGKSFESYADIIPRFVSEFGWQSFPAWSTLQDAVGPEMPTIDAPVMVHHQRQPGSNERLRDYAKQYFGPAKDLAELCYHTQLVQGLALKHGVEHWRRSKPRCMGTLYWQLNDCWVVASWASVDYTLRYKAAHYFAKRFYAPLIGSLVDKGAVVEVWLTSDLAAAADVEYVLEAWHVDGRRLGERRGTATLAAADSRTIANVPWQELAGGEARDQDVLLRLVTTADGQRHENLLVRAGYKDLPLLSPAIETTVEPVGDQARVRVSCRRPALFVELDSAAVSGVFNDNYFALFPGHVVEVNFTPASGQDAAGLAQTLQVRALNNAR